MNLKSNDIALHDKKAEDRIWNLLATVSDPEIPVLSIVDLGIVRNVRFYQPGIKGEYLAEIFITPTYSGCPAMNIISIEIKMTLLENGFKNVKLIQQLSPAWTTDWMSKEGKEKLKAYGIAPPQNRSIPSSINRISKIILGEDVTVQCPQCNSTNTNLVSHFGSTSCKALYQCNFCKEPFDYFKCH